MSILLFWSLTLIIGSAILSIYIYQSYQLTKCEQNLNLCHIIDAITNLPNRQALERDFKKGMTPGKEHGIILLNIDNFKMVNDLLGYQEGNNLIQEISERMIDSLTNEEALYHFGGDMFAIYLKHVVSKWQVEQLVKQLFETLEKPLVLETSQLFISFCGGIALCPTDAKDFHNLIRFAELSMYVAKKQGHNHYEFFSRSLLDALEKQSVLERELRYALNHQEFTLQYQPKVSLQNYHVTGYEALLRWQSHLLGSVPPDLFIKVAEETGLIIPIGRWVFYESCMAIKRINERSLLPKTMAINISVIELLQENFIPQVLSIIKGLQIPPVWIEIELTESIFLDNKDIVIQKLRELQRYGLVVSIDDFGKEYSALSYLIKLPIDNIKIDKIFIDTIGTTEEWIVPTLIDICHKMKCLVIAEGVETQEQLAFLKQVACDKVQGYVFSKPLKEEELLGLHFEL